MTTAPHLPPTPIDVERSADGWRVVPRGDLDVVSGPRLAGALDATGLDGDAGAAVTVDLTDVGFVDSAGLRALLRLQDRLQAQGHELHLEAVDDRLHRLLEITGLAPRLLG